MMCRRWCSPWISRWSRHSRRSVPTYRSAKEFARGRPDGSLDDPRAVVGEYVVEDAGELAIAVTDQEFEAAGAFAEVHEQVAALLRGPRSGGLAVTPRMCTRRT